MVVDVNDKELVRPAPGTGTRTRSNSWSEDNRKTDVYPCAVECTGQP